MTSNLDVRLAVEYMVSMEAVCRYTWLTGVDQGYGIINSLFSVRLKDLSHVREWRLPFKSVSKVAVSAHRTQKATRRSNLGMK